jgi:archaellum biogenesis ATPase FlaH
MTNVLIEGLKERISNAIKTNQTIGIILPAPNYPDLVQALFERILKNPGEAWVYVTITKTCESLFNENEFLENCDNIKFIDCVSKGSGLNKPISNCIYIESPTMLEKLGLEIINTFKEVNDEVEKYLVIDSLTNLIIYNDPEIVTEFFYYIKNRTRVKNIHTISIAVEEEGLDKCLNRLIYLNDKILKVKDSFI